MNKVLTVLFALALVLVFAAFCHAGEWTEALDDVNAIRQANGLPLYKYDEGLTQAAAKAAAFRAERFLFGHTQNDFQFLPAGSTAHAAGCAAYPPDHGFMACAMFDDYTHAGAAYVIGADGKAYCHLFVSGGSGRTLGQRNFNFVRALTKHLKVRAKEKVETIAETGPLVIGTKPVVVPLQPVVEYETRYVQQCQNGVCRTVAVRVPKAKADGFTIQGAAKKPLPVGPTAPLAVQPPALTVEGPRFPAVHHLLHPFGGRFQGVLQGLGHRLRGKGGCASCGG